MLNFPAGVWSSLALLLTLTSASDVDYCPAASEGSRFELNCGGNLTSAQNFIEWISTDTTRSGNPNTTLTLCGVESMHCETSSKTEYSVTNSGMSGKFHSKLVVHNVSAKHRSLRFACQIWDMHRDKKPVILYCQMAVYKSGKYHKNTTTVLRGGRIQLRYSVRDAFPGIFCQFSEKIDGKTARSNQPMKSTSEPDGDKSLYSCEAIVYPLIKGNYTFDVEVKPNYPTAFDSTFYIMGPIEVDKSPTVKIEQVGQATRCNESDKARVRCIVDWFDGPEPEFQFSFSKESLILPHYRDRFDNNDYTYKYVAEYRVPMNKYLFKALMVCRVGYTYDRQQGYLNDTKHFEFRYHPEKALFRSQDHDILKSLFDINRGENATLECRAAGGHPKVSSIRVVCIGNGANISSTFNASDRVSFVVYGNNTYQKAFCACYIQHETNVCNQGRELMEVIFLRVEQRLGNHRDPEKPDVVNKMTPVYYIIMATLVLVFLPIVIGTCVFIHKKGASLYYTYTRKKGISLPQEENAPRFSSNGPNTTSRHPAPPPIPERQQPAPPVPPRPTLLSEEKRGQDSIGGAIGYLNEQVWMDDPETEISEQPDQTFNKKPNRKKSKRTEANVSVSSDDYLIPLGRTLSSVNSQNDDVFSNSEELYLKMGGVKEKGTDPNFNSFGFAPSLPKRRMPSAPIWRSEDTDLDNTGVKLLNNPMKSQGADVTLAKRLDPGRCSPLRYVKLKEKGDRRRRDTGSESDTKQQENVLVLENHPDELVGRHNRRRRDTGSESNVRHQVDAFVQERDPMLDTNLGVSSDEESPINVDIGTLDVRPPDSGHFTQLVDSHDSGHSSLTTRVPRLENIYVDNTSIY